VPPPPSVGGTGNGSGGNGAGRFSALGAGGNGVVPPPPSVSGAGNGTGAGGTGREGSMIAGGAGVVAPPPSLAGAGNSNGGGTGGGFGNGRGAGIPGGDLNGVAPPGGGGGGSTGQPLEPMDPLDVPQSQPAAPPPAVEDLSVRFMEIPGASGRSSFFKGFEVVIAEIVAGSRSEQIKLVYTSLPYEKRLAEYDLETTKIYKLRAIKDPGCDESLMQMMWPEGEGAMDAQDQAAADKLIAKVGDKNTRLHCYRTTAVDFARAVQRGR